MALPRAAVEARLGRLGIQVTLMPRSIGHEVRCADPIPFDMEYTRDLGYCAARYILGGGSEATVAIVDGHFHALPFVDMRDPATGRPRVRMVDVDSDRYRIARAFMLRLKRLDFDDPAQLARLSQVAHLSPEGFREQFFHLVQREASPGDQSGFFAQRSPGDFEVKL